MNDVDLDCLVEIDARIAAADRAGLRERWEFGRRMLAARDGAGRLPGVRRAILLDPMQSEGAPSRPPAELGACDLSRTTAAVERVPARVAADERRVPVDMPAAV